MDLTLFSLYLNASLGVKLSEGHRGASITASFVEADVQINWLKPENIYICFD